MSCFLLPFFNDPLELGSFFLVTSRNKNIWINPATKVLKRNTDHVLFQCIHFSLQYLCITWFAFKSLVWKSPCSSEWNAPQEMDPFFLLRASRLRLGISFIFHVSVGSHKVQASLNMREKSILKESKRHTEFLRCTELWTIMMAKDQKTSKV